VWRLAGAHAPDADTNAGQPLVIDVDATLVTRTDLHSVHVLEAGNPLSGGEMV
jgi:hypothetical protein